ncbi:hypothetical protein RRSWK_04704 [Rhodopirellula sp. SWK7]|nr:hypothetical protein RRSWK_04704 [Rhodopirellula sp. SWK7]
MTPDETESLLGVPQRKSTNFRKELTYDYEAFNVGFSNSKLVTHVGFVPGASVEYDGQPLLTAESFRRLVQLDADAKEVLGFVVLLNLGIAFTGFHDNDDSQKAVTAFERGSYEEFSHKMKQFALSST